MEALMHGQSDEVCESMLARFMTAHTLALAEEDTPPQQHMRAVVELGKRRAGLLYTTRKLEECGLLLCRLAVHCTLLSEFDEAEKHAREAHDIGLTTNSLTLHVESCLGLASVYLLDENHAVENTEKGIEMLRQAVLATELGGTAGGGDVDKATQEVRALRLLAIALIEKTVDGLDEAVDIVKRLRMEAKEMSRRDGRLRFEELDGLCIDIRLCEANAPPAGCHCCFASTSGSVRQMPHPLAATVVLHRYPAL